jgi:hypothetical protein
METMASFEAFASKDWGKNCRAGRSPVRDLMTECPKYEEELPPARWQLSAAEVPTSIFFVINNSFTSVNL